MDEPEWILASRSLLTFLEADGEGSPAQLREVLRRLLAAAEPLALPDTDEEAPEQELNAAYRHFYGRAEDRFPAFSQAHREDGGWAADDLGDIGQEIQRVVRSWEADLREAALWEFRFGYEHHWGAAHAVPLLAWLEANAFNPQ